MSNNDLRKSSQNNFLYYTNKNLMCVIKQYCSSHKNTRFVDYEEIADYLQQNFSEYKRKKRAILVTSIKDAINKMKIMDEDDVQIISETLKIVPPNQIQAELEKNCLDKEQSSIKNLENTQISTAMPIQEMPNYMGENKHKKKVTFSALLPVKRKKFNSIEPLYPTLRLSDIGGISSILEVISKMLIHLKYPEVYKALGIDPPRGVLLHGPPGCGKTLLVHAITGELNLPLFRIAATELISGISGESEEQIRSVFDQAVNYAPCVLFIDEIDAIVPKRDTVQREMEKRIVSQFLSSLDLLNIECQSGILIIGATNRPDALDPALRRAGRFDREICLGMPNESARKEILQVICRKVKLGDDVDFLNISRLTPGFVGADLKELVREAAVMAALSILPEESLYVDSLSNKDTVTNCNNLPQKKNFQISEKNLKEVYVKKIHFDSALHVVQPSALREGFVTVPNVTWNDIGALADIKEELKLAIMLPLNYPDKWAELGLNASSGLIFYGPPGCGKTLLAKAISNEMGINFISVKGPELLSMYVGESEKAVRQCFQRAHNSAPCIIFFDEIDSLCPRRSEASDSSASSRIVNQMLTELDGVCCRQNVFVIAATNRVDILDPAILRPGRLDKMLYIGLPSSSERVEILKAITKNNNKPHILDISIEEIGNNSLLDGFSGADLAGLIREAALIALKENVNSDQELGITWKNIKKDKEQYDKMRKLYSST